MRKQMIEITGQTLFISVNNERPDSYRDGKQGIIPNLQGSYWMHIYPPISDMRSPISGSSRLCPWSMIAEITDAATPRGRKQQILDALRSGQRTMSLYGLPSHRILFMEDAANKQISIWVD